MTIEQLRKVHTSRPFNTFSLHLADGREIRVEHPELLAHQRTGRTIAVATSDDVFEIIDLMLVVSLETANGERATK